MSKLIIVASSLAILAGLQVNITQDVPSTMDGDPFNIIATLKEDGSVDLGIGDLLLTAPKDSAHLLHSMTEGQSYVMRCRVGRQGGAIRMVRTGHGLELEQFMAIGEPESVEEESTASMTEEKNVSGIGRSELEKRVEQLELEKVNLQESVRLTKEEAQARSRQFEDAVKEKERIIAEKDRIIDELRAQVRST